MKELDLILKRPDFVVYDTRGAVRELYCKVCSTQIAGGVPFQRYANYAELKFSCDDGSLHVTNGCRKCLTRSTSKKILSAMLVADMTDLNKGLPLDIEPDILNAFMNVRKAGIVKARGVDGKAAI